MTGMGGYFLTVCACYDSTGALIVSFINVRARRMAVGPRMGMVLGSSSRLLRRIMIANCNAFGGTSFAKTTSAMGASALRSMPILSITSGLSNGITNIAFNSDSDGPNSMDDVHMHNVNSVGTKGGPLCIVSKAPIADKSLSRFACDSTKASVLSSLGAGSVRSVAIVGSTTTTSLCNSHTTGNIIIVAAGDKGRNGAGMDFHSS